MHTKNFKIDTADLLLFEINNESKIIIKGEKQANVSLKIGHHISHNLKERKIRVQLSLILQNESNDDTAKFEISCFYLIQNIKNYLVSFEEEQVFHPQLITTLLSISFSTSRGIIFEKLKDTSWENTILPIVSPIKILSYKEN